MKGQGICRGPHGIQVESGEFEDRTFSWKSWIQGRSHSARMGVEFFNSKKYRHSVQRLERLPKVLYGGLDFTLIRKDENRGDQAARTSSTCSWTSILEEARKGLSIQRYKGSGRNESRAACGKPPWIPDKRTMLQVSRFMTPLRTRTRYSPSSWATRWSPGGSSLKSNALQGPGFGHLMLQFECNTY